MTRLDTTHDRVARFGCGFILGVILAFATLFPVGAITLMGLPLQFASDAVILGYVIAVPMIVGGVVAWRGERVVLVLLRALGTLETPCLSDETDPRPGRKEARDDHTETP